jgi:hypothetical protein
MCVIIVVLFVRLYYYHIVELNFNLFNLVSERYLMFFGGLIDDVTPAV